MALLNRHVGIALSHYCKQIEKHFRCNILAYVGGIDGGVLDDYVTSIERIATRGRRVDSEVKEADWQKERLVIVLTTPGGIAETVERMVEVTRHHFQEIYFAVPNYAMSAGTIFCMSGDKIYMDYTSSLGPIDPQIGVGGQLVPALGYIDKVEEFIEKSRAGSLTQAELIMLQRLDLANLRRYEQARNLSISLLKEWLVRYKFKDWAKHRTTNPGAPVTDAERQQRAEDIAKMLSDNRTWHSHGRMIGIDKIRGVLRLEVEDYSDEKDLRFHLRSYGNLLSEFVSQQSLPFFIHYADKELT